jgi:hypothetical protein
MGFAATAKFPTAVAGVADLLNWQNKLVSTTEPQLLSSINATVTTLTLTAGTGAAFPTDNFSITIDSEIIFVGTRTTDTLSSLVRGSEGTTGAAHSANANVDAYITAKSHNQLAAEVNAIEAALGTSLSNVLLLSQLGAVNGVCQLDASGNVAVAQLGTVVNTSQLGVASGVATLDGTGKLTAAQIPSGLGGGASLSVANTWTAKQTFPASVTGGTGINVGAAGTQPTTGVDGDVYIDATSHALKYFTNASWHTTEWQANKNAASGYCGLDSGGLVAVAQLPATVVLTTTKDSANGYHGLDSNGLEDEAPTGCYPKFASQAAVTAATSTTGDQNMMQWSVPAGYCDVVGRIIRLSAFGVYAVGGSACNMTIKFAFINIASIMFATFPVSASGSGSWYIQCNLIRTASGISGTSASGGTVQIQGAQISPASSTFSADLTVARTLCTAVNFSVASTSNTCTQRFMLAERINW